MKPRHPDSTRGTPAPHRKEQPPRKEQEKLDEGVEETFPASDPVSVSVPPKEREWTPEELAEAERKRRQSRTEKAG